MTTRGPSPIDRDRLFSLFEHMVDLYSPSGKEQDLAAFLENYLSQAGLNVCCQPVDEDRYNLLVSTGTSPPDTLFLGHIDTVPAFDIEHYGFSCRNGHCYGLGTADMKGGCAALVEAFLTAAKNGRLPDSVLLALVVGEEETGDGTQALLASHRFRNALVAEPTEVRPCLQHYGYVEMLIRAFGYRRHAAVSNRDTNAIRALLRLLLRLEDRIEQDEPETVMNIRDLHSSESGFAVPDRCAAGVDLHLPPHVRVEPYAEELRRFIQEHLDASGASHHEIDFPTLANGYRIDPQDPFPLRLREVYLGLKQPWTPGSFQSHSDANLLWEAECRPIILGPGQLARAHTRDESVAADQVATAADLYLRLLDTLYEPPAEDASRSAAP